MGGRHCCSYLSTTRQRFYFEGTIKIKWSKKWLHFPIVIKQYVICLICFHWIRNDNNVVNIFFLFFTNFEQYYRVYVFDPRKNQVNYEIILIYPFSSCPSNTSLVIQKMGNYDKCNKYFSPVTSYIFLCSLNGW